MKKVFYVDFQGVNFIYGNGKNFHKRHSAYLSQICRLKWEALQTRVFYALRIFCGRKTSNEMLL